MEQFCGWFSQDPNVWILRSEVVMPIAAPCDLPMDPNSVAMQYYRKDHAPKTSRGTKKQKALFCFLPRQAIL